MVEEKPSISLLPKYLQEDELSQECRELISTLPTEKAWFMNDIHQYQGFWHTPKQIQGLLSCQKHFQAQDTDIILATHPKSGTTWLKALTFSLLNRKKYSTIQNQNHPLATNNPHNLVPFLEIDLYQVKDFVPDLSTFSSPRLFATHLAFVLLPNSVKDSNCKVVYICRDPKDTFISLWHFANRLRTQNRGTNSLEESFDKFVRGVNVGGPYCDHVLSYWKESLEKPKKVMFLRYEDMKMNPCLVLKDLAEFLGCPFSKEEEDEGLADGILKMCSFDKLSNLEVNLRGTRPSGIENKTYFRLGEVGDWKNHLTVEMIEQLNTVTEERLGVHGIRF